MKRFITILSLTLIFYACTLVYPDTRIGNNKHANDGEHSSSATPLLDKAMAGDIDELVQLLITRKNNIQQIYAASCKTLIIVVATQETLLTDEYNNLLKTGHRAGFDHVHILEDTTIQDTYYMFIYKPTQKGPSIASLSTTEDGTMNTNDCSRIHTISQDGILQETIWTFLLPVQNKIFEQYAYHFTNLVVLLPPALFEQYNLAFLPSKAALAKFENTWIMKNTATEYPILIIFKNHPKERLQHGTVTFSADGQNIPQETAETKVIIESYIQEVIERAVKTESATSIYNKMRNSAKRIRS